MNSQTIDTIRDALYTERARLQEMVAWWGEGSSRQKRHQREIDELDAALAELAELEQLCSQPKTEQALLPCPFCGGEAKIEEAFYDCNHYWVQCAACNNSTWSHEEVDSAIVSWNRRTTAQEGE